MQEKTLLEIEASSTKRVLKKSIYTIASFIQFIFSKYLIILIFVGIGVAISIIKYNLIQPKYESKTTLTSEVYDMPILCEILNNLNFIIEQGDIPELAKQLKIPVKTAVYISGISATEKTKKDTVNNAIVNQSLKRIELLISSSKRETLNLINKQTIHYLESNPYIATHLPIPTQSKAVTIIHSVTVKKSTPNLFTLIKQYIYLALIASVLYLLYKKTLANKSS